MYHLAQINIALMKAPVDDPSMKEFVASLDPLNELAEKSEGFVWRLKGYGNNATSIRVMDDDMMLVNLSVWKDADSLFRYVYQSAHKEIFRRRGAWFNRVPEMQMALWYVSQGHIPSVQEGLERLMHLREHGETEYAFSFKKQLKSS